MNEPISTDSVAAQLSEFHDRLSAFHEDIVAMHGDVRRMIASMLRCERIANGLLSELTQATERLRQESERAPCI